MQTISCTSVLKLNPMQDETATDSCFNPFTAALSHLQSAELMHNKILKGLYLFF